MPPERLNLFFQSLWTKVSHRKHRLPPTLKSSPRMPSPHPFKSAQNDTWDLDPQFFAALSRWTLDHPERSIDRVMENICVGIDCGKELLELIPDSPFPARGLVKALAHLVKLGVTISSAARDVQDFAKQIVHWVSQVKLAFDGSGGVFTDKLWTNLADTRALVDEICKWAIARLEDGRWSRIKYPLTIAKEIDEFKSRIASARAIFTNLAVINLAQGQDVLIQSVRDLTMVVQQTQTDQLASILDELEAQNVALKEQMEAEIRRQFLAYMLSPRTIANTGYSDQGKHPCDSDTRVDVLKDIRQWIYDVGKDSKSFLWLTGDPGCGKSAVTASVARQCKDEHILWAQFFINRNLSDTTNPAFYFPSIARQLADRSRIVARAIHDALKEKPSLMDDISQYQAGKLFVEALTTASATDPSQPVVVIVDALDETDPDRLRVTAEIFSQALVSLPNNAKVFISSRTEDDIRKPFSNTFDDNHVKHIHLDTSADSSVQDVSTFLGRNIAEIVKRHDLDILEWPGEDRFRGLCDQASGLFIWAVTTIKFIEVQVEMWGKECLDYALDELNTKGMGDINKLYGVVLRLAHRNHNDLWVFEAFRRIVGCIVVLRQPLCLDDIGVLLNLQKTTNLRPMNLVQYIRRLRTVLVSGTDAVDGTTIPRLHKSFFEYITSERADPEYRVTSGTSHGEVLVQCLHHLAKLGSEGVSGFHSALARYALAFWTLHLPARIMAGVTLADSLSISQIEELLNHPYVSDLDRSSSVYVMFSSDKKHVILSEDKTSHLMDANSATEYAYTGIITGHTKAVAAVAFSPDGQKIVSGSYDTTLCLWNAKNGKLIGGAFKGHTRSVVSVAFSPDGRYIVSGSADYTLQMWDVQTGKIVRPSFRGHTASVGSVAFSPDGKHIVSGSFDGMLCLWNAENGQQAGPPLQGYGKHVPVLSVAFSPDGREIISGSDDGTLCVWDAQSHKAIGSPFRAHAQSVTVRAVAFSPNGRYIISSDDWELCLWDAEKHEKVGKAFHGHTNIVLCVAFSPDGKQVISGSADHTLRLWDTETYKCIGSSFKGHSGAVHSVAFSPDGKHIISGASDQNIRIWDKASHQTLEHPFKSHPSRLTSVALSPDGKHMISASLDDSVHLWDARTAQSIGLPLNNVKKVVSFVFSPDRQQFATISSDGTIHLWNQESHELLGSYCKEHINKMTHLTFSSDGTHLTSFSIGGTSHTWNPSTGEPIGTSQSSISVLDHAKVMAFSMEKAWCDGGFDGALLQCFPTNNTEFGHWAYIDGTIIQRDKTGSTIITDVKEVLESWNKTQEVRKKQD